MLTTKFVPAESSTEKPTLVFLHGLLGCSNDWLQVSEQLSDYNRLFIDLPGHGTSRDSIVIGFDDTCKMIAGAIADSPAQQSPILLVGYSLGARLLMYGMVNSYFASVKVVGCVVEGGNFGLTSQSEKQLRLQNDQRWAECFTDKPMTHVLQKWYQQPVFVSLTDRQRAHLVEQRLDNSGVAIGRMLLATSLAKQPFLLDRLLQYKMHFHYVCGENDLKFYQLATSSGLVFTAIKEAGHNVHHEQPAQFASLIRTQTEQFITNWNESWQEPSE